jgi:acetyl-CoA carboxylase biotin carboxyl carrier protein
MDKPELDLERIRELIAVMRESGVSELSVELPQFKVSLRREAGAADLPDAFAPEPIVAANPAAPHAGHAPTLLPVMAPMVGIFRAATEQGRKVAVGDSVAAGQVIGAIEAMKVPNDIPAPVSGIVREVLASDGAPVEYGQPLMLIEPRAGAEGVEVEAEAL